MIFPLIDVEQNVPQGEHPGAFAAHRKYHIHEGVDIYAPKIALVYAIQTGIVTAIHQFTGIAVGSPWWHDTYAIAVTDDTGTWVYGEIQAPRVYHVGDIVQEGHYIAQLKQVLKVDKGRPMTMLHFERWKLNYGPHTFLWQLGHPQPEFILDPAPLLLEIK